MCSQSRTHVVMFPFMAQGHTLPLLDLAKAFSFKQIKVTIITTPSNATSISSNLDCSSNICLTELPFPSMDELPRGCENTSQLPSMQYFVPFLFATKKLQKPFEQALKRMLESDNPPICVISDFFLGWTLPICETLGVPRLVFHGMSVLSMAISKSSWMHKPHLKTTSVFDPIDLPNLKLPFTLTSKDLPAEILNAQNEDDPLSQYISEVGEADVNSWGVIVNSVEELENSYIPSFESFYARGKAWCLGPLFLYDKMKKVERSINQNHSSFITQWLDDQVSPDSVIYVSFGTQADVSDNQLDEVAFGLEQSGFGFVWVVRSRTWTLTTDVKENLRGRGLIIRDWVDQREILSHRATGGFLSHCGWNSVLESITAGVPILAWPMIAEQPLNARLIADGLGAGLSLNKFQNQGTETVVSRDAICEAVRELMGGEEGNKARERAQALGRVARRAVQIGGSSDSTLNKLVQ
ncbi:hypothetical protein K2173_000518 [Erythroxylum novogranatense]|uniref:Glycosyltransferase n=1 Tax=Erythroxylum novogranatense TaxID=1862640 RepID=A0AAV8SWG2_9ROSI|nr:hypothetical protein K2173_000518 [Erythroxylum novogranatense]